jgi:hypothetical protein
MKAVLSSVGFERKGTVFINCLEIAFHKRCSVFATRLEKRNPPGMLCTSFDSQAEGSRYFPAKAACAAARRATGTRLGLQLT